MYEFPKKTRLYDLRWQPSNPPNIKSVPRVPKYLLLKFVLIPSSFYYCTIFHKISLLYLCKASITKLSLVGSSVLASQPSEEPPFTNTFHPTQKRKIKRFTKVMVKSHQQSPWLEILVEPTSDSNWSSWRTKPMRTPKSLRIRNWRLLTSNTSPNRSNISWKGKPDRRFVCWLLLVRLATIVSWCRMCRDGEGLTGHN